MKKFILASLLLLSSPAYADHKTDHMCMDVAAFEKEFAEKNPNYEFEVKRFSKIDTMNFIAFSLMELNVPPPDEDPSKITGMYYLTVKGHEKGFVAILNGERICSNTMINKKAFDILMEALGKKSIET